MKKTYLFIGFMIFVFNGASNLAYSEDLRSEIIDLGLTVDEQRFDLLHDTEKLTSISGALISGSFSTTQTQFKTITISLFSPKSVTLTLRTQPRVYFDFFKTVAVNRDNRTIRSISEGIRNTESALTIISDDREPVTGGHAIIMLVVRAPQKEEVTYVLNIIFESKNVFLHSVNPYTLIPGEPHVMKLKQDMQEIYFTTDLIRPGRSVYIHYSLKDEKGELVLEDRVSPFERVQLNPTHFGKKVIVEYYITDDQNGFTGETNQKIIQFIKEEQ